MPPTEKYLYARQQAYRLRLAAAGKSQVLLTLSCKTVAVIDEIKKRHGLDNRGQVLEQPRSAREMLKLLAQGSIADQQ